MKRISFFARLLLLGLVLMPLAASFGLAQNDVSPVRRAPVSIISTPPAIAVAGTPYSYQVRTSTASVGAVVRYRLTTAPQGMTIDSTSGLIAWNPSTQASVRVSVVAYLVTNASQTATQNFGITILPQSAAQAMVRFTTTAPNSANVGGQYVYNVRAYYGVDNRLSPTPRYAPAITYSLVNAPAGMVLNQTAATIRWIPTTTGTVGFSIRAVAATLATTSMNAATQDVEVTVRQVQPQFFSQPSREAFVGFEYQYRAIASLPFIQANPATNGIAGLPTILPGLSQMTYSLITAPQGMTIDATSGIVRWTPSMTSASVAVSIRATAVGNTSQTVTQSFTIAVTFPRVNFATQPPSNASLGQNYIYEPIAIVGNNFATILPINPPVQVTIGSLGGILGLSLKSTPGLRFSLDEAPQGMAIDAATGVVRWAVSTIGTFRISIRATMATNAAITGVQTYSLRVSLPTARFTSEPGAAFINTGQDFSYRAQAVIPGMTTATLRYGLDMPPQGMTIDSVTGQISWRPNFAGTFNIIVTARLAGQTAVIARQNFPLYVRPAVCAVIRGEVRYTNTTATVMNGIVRAVSNSTAANVANGSQLVYTGTVTNGRFSINVASGSYLIAVTGNDYNEVWWGNGIVPTTSMATATPTVVNCGDSVLRTLGVARRAAAKFFTLSGRVTRRATGTAVQAMVEVLGDPPPSIAAQILRRTVRTDAQGNYSISLDDRYEYVVRALPDNAPTSTAQLLPQYYTGSSAGTQNLTEARKITLTANLANINFALADRPVFQNSLSGSVQSSTGQPLAGKIIAYMTATTASTPQYASIDIRTEVVSSAGTFSITNLTPGEYVLQAVPNSTREFPQSYFRSNTTSTTTWRQATRITVTPTSNERVVIIIQGNVPSTKAVATVTNDDAEVITLTQAQTPTNQTLTTTSVRNQTPQMRSLGVAPNPASQLVVVNIPMFTGEGRLEVLSLRGETVFSSMLTANASGSSLPLNVADFASGMYVVRFISSDVRAVAQVLVSH